MTKLNPDQHLLLIDLETTGLKPTEEKILEVGLVVVTLDFQVVAQFHGLIEPPNFDPDDLDENVYKMHERSGLLKEIDASGRDQDEVEEELVEWYDELFGDDVQVPLSGSSVHFDVDFLKEHFIDFPERVHYREINWSTVKELCRRYNPDVYKKLPAARKLHRSLPDLQDTISEARFYVENFLFTTV